MEQTPDIQCHTDISCGIIHLRVQTSLNFVHNVIPYPECWVQSDSALLNMYENKLYTVRYVCGHTPP